MTNSTIKIRRGLDLPIEGAPEQQIEVGPKIRSVAVLGTDYPGMKPTMLVQEGEQVKIGQPLFNCKKTAGVLYTSPAGGRVAAINRGDKRALLSVTIDVEEDQAQQFKSFSESELESVSRDQIQENLVQSGQWTAFKTRPYSKVPTPGTAPHSIFVTAMDSNPLAADPAVVIAESTAEFRLGLAIISKLTDGSVHLCTSPQFGAEFEFGQVKRTAFAGPHPSGLAGTHIHFLDPVGVDKVVWSINYQDVIAIAKLFLTGAISTERVVALAGPEVSQPRLLRTRLGASIDELCAGQLNSTTNVRLISGSVLSGHHAQGPLAFLGRYHAQISVLKEGNTREFMAFMSPGVKRHSKLNIYLTSLIGGRNLPLNTSTNGSPRSMVPVGTYEEVMPLDILPTHLLRYLIVGDTEMAQQLGCLELDEEDLALCTYVCPGKYEYGPILRDNLTLIEKEG